jgi:hypothetical protein
MTAPAVRAASLCLAALALAAAEPARADEPPPQAPPRDLAMVDRAEILGQLARVEVLLHEAATSSRPVGQPHLDELRARLGAIRRAVSEAHPAPHHRRGQPMDADGFETLRRSVDSALPSDGLAMVRAAAGGWFLASQVRALAKSVPFREQKLEVVRALHRRVVDPENLWQLIEELPFDREKLVEILEK